jgi:hypothetical protein
MEGEPSFLTAFFAVMSLRSKHCGHGSSGGGRKRATSTGRIGHPSQRNTIAGFTREARRAGR